MKHGGHWNSLIKTYRRCICSILMLLVCDFPLERGYPDDRRVQMCCILSSTDEKRKV
jgi:hypothetical protein